MGQVAKIRNIKLLLKHLSHSWKNRSSSELLYKSNRPQVSMVFRHDKPLGMLEEHSKNS